jgi:hypothetical protein
MDDTLRLIQHLYGDDGDDPAFARRMETDDALRREYEALRETKAALDRRAAPSPDPAVVDAIVDRAADATRPPDEADPPASGPAPDRAPRDPDRTPTRRLRGVTALLAVLLVAGVGWWQFRDAAPSPAGTTAASPAATAADPAADEGGPAPRADAMPEWDDRDEVARLHRRIEMLRTRSDGWGGTPQPVGQAGP